MPPDEMGAAAPTEETADHQTDPHRQDQVNANCSAGDPHGGALADILLADAVELAEHHWPVFPLLGKVPHIGNPHPVGTEGRKKCKGECGLFGHRIRKATHHVPAVSALWEYGNPKGYTEFRAYAVLGISNLTPNMKGTPLWYAI